VIDPGVRPRPAAHETIEWYRYNDLQFLHLFESEQWKLKT
jgi:hypothetical protein